jgi:methylenetetrahydrofolate reductase (NADPH)
MDRLGNVDFRPMRIDERLAAVSQPTFSFEFFPPKTEEGERSLAYALGELSHLQPTFVSVTYGAGGTTEQKLKTLDIVSRIKQEHDLEAMAHFTTVGATVDELRATLDMMRDAGVQNVLALRGDPPQGQDEWVQTEGGLNYSRELIELIRDNYGFCIGAACFPEVHVHAESGESDLCYTKEKVDAGASFLITQLFFDNKLYYDFVARAREIGIDVPIIPGIMPVTNVEQLRRFTTMCGASIPGRLMRDLEARADDPAAVAQFGVAYATLQCADLLARGAPGIHFYTLNKSPSTRAILSALRCLAPWRDAVPV